MASMSEAASNSPSAGDPGTLAPDPGLEDQLSAEVFRALGDPNRLRILSCLSAHGRPASVQVVSRCVAIDYSVVARHLKVLARAGLLAAQRDGRSTCYALRRDDVVGRFRALAEAFAHPSGACGPASGCADDAAGCCDEPEPGGCDEPPSPAP